MRMAARRSLLSVALVSGLILGLVPASAQVAVNTGSVDVRNVLAGTANKEFKITVNRNAGTAVNAVIMHIPPGFGVIEGRAAGWQSHILDPDRVLFLGGTIPPAGSQAFSIFANVPTPNQDITSRWAAGASSDGGETYSEVDPSGSGTMDTTTRVLQVTSLGITAPDGAKDSSVTGAQDNVKTVCQVQNVGSGTLLVDATLSGSRYQTSDPAAVNIAPGGTQAFTFDMTFDDVTSTTSTNAECEGFSAGRASTGNRNVFGKRFDISIQPRAVFDYVVTSLSPKMAAPVASPIFSVRVNKHQNGQVSLTGSDTSPAVTIKPPSPAGATTNGTDFKLSGGACNTPIGPAPLGAATSVDAGRQDNALLQFAPLAIPATQADGDCNVIINVGGTDANGADLVAAGHRPLNNTVDTVRIDASIPVISLPNLSGEGSRCCNQPEASTHGDSLDFSGNVTDRNSATGQQEPCGTCEVILSELRQYSTVDAAEGSQIGQTFQVQVTNASGALSGSHTVATFDPAAKSIRFAIVVKDQAGNKSNSGVPTFSNVIPVDLLAPTIVEASASPAPSAANADLQRQLRVKFSEPVDNFNRPLDGLCPGADWRADNNTVLSCSRDADFLGGGLLVSNELPDDTPGFNLAYFPQTPLTFHDRVGIPIQTGTTVNVIDRIPPKAPVIDKVSGRAAQSDGRFYTNLQPNKSFELSNGVLAPGARPQAVKAGYTVQLWQENGLADGLQTDGANSDLKIGQEVAQGTSVTVTPTTGLTADSTLQEGKEYTVYARSLDIASPANATPANIVRAFKVIVDTVAPGIKTVAAQIDRVHVDFNETIVGQNSATHWKVKDVDGFSMVVARVEGTGPARDVVIDDARYQQARAASVHYIFFGVPANRYSDRAGNPLPDTPAAGLSLK